MPALGRGGEVEALTHLAGERRDVPRRLVAQPAAAARRGLLPLAQQPGDGRLVLLGPPLDGGEEFAPRAALGAAPLEVVDQFASATARAS